MTDLAGISAINFPLGKGSHLQFQTVSFIFCAFFTFNSHMFIATLAVTSHARLNVENNLGDGPSDGGPGLVGVVGEVEGHFDARRIHQRADGVLAGASALGWAAVVDLDGSLLGVAAGQAEEGLSLTARAEARLRGKVVLRRMSEECTGMVRLSPFLPRCCPCRAC